MTKRYRVFREPPYVVVQVDDYELSDWFADVLTEDHDLEIQLFRDRTDERYELLLSDSVPISLITSILDGLDPDEVERVFLINNS